MSTVNPNNFNPQGQNHNGLILDGALLNTARNSWSLPGAKSGNQLFKGNPGRILGNKQNFYYNSGTSNNGAYIPPFNSSGKIIGLETAPPGTSGDPSRAIAELDLIPNGDGTYRRDGFNGTYTVGENGGIVFSGGHHGNRGKRIDCPPQVYFAGKGWFKQNSVSSSGFGGAVSASAKADVFTSNQGLGGSISAGGSVSVGGDVFSSLSSMSGNQPASTQTTSTKVYAKDFNKIIDGLRRGGTITPPKVEDIRKDWKAHRDNHLAISKEVTKFLGELNNQEKTPENIKLAVTLFDYHNDFMSNLEDALVLNHPNFFKKTGEVELPNPDKVLSKLLNEEDVSPPSVAEIAKDRVSVRKNMDKFREVLKGITDGNSFNKLVGFYQQYSKNYLTARDAELTKFNAARKDSFSDEIEVTLSANGQLQLSPGNQAGPNSSPSPTNSSNSVNSNPTNQASGKVNKQSLEKKIQSYLGPIGTGLQSQNPSLLNFSMSRYNSADELQSLLSQLQSLGQTYKPGDAQKGDFESALRDLKTLIEEKKAEDNGSTPDPNAPKDLLDD